ncbi:hypothetical protein AG1IA_02053 [Rhizoctonia solani AG-1 IA]|uniref:Uncharacterized protein n=1 Tax=Thanatephorus cucumeris (strain AG1-IA) TaxID=983506 RepID=L8X113_THACA|nr:hypothetical protein AG1IA_02053 [Rhizoctonia solani AG-1 IA]
MHDDDDDSCDRHGSSRLCRSMRRAFGEWITPSSRAYWKVEPTRGRCALRKTMDIFEQNDRRCWQHLATVCPKSGGIFTGRMPGGIKTGRVKAFELVPLFPPLANYACWCSIERFGRGLIWHTDGSSHIHPSLSARDWTALIRRPCSGTETRRALRSPRTLFVLINSVSARGTCACPLLLPTTTDCTMTTRAWIPRTPTLDYESDHQPSPINPMYHDHEHEQSPADTWLSPAMASNDDVDMMFDLDFNRPDAFCSLLDDTASRREQHAILQRWHTPGYSMPTMTKAKANVLSRQPTLDATFIASEWEEKLIRRWQRKHKKQHLSLREVKSQMPPLEFDPAFADSDTEDEDEQPAFNPESLREPLMRRVPSPIAIPPSAYAPSAPLSPLTPLSSEPPQSSISPVDKPSPRTTQAPAVPESYAPPTPMSPAVKLEVVDDVLYPARSSPALKRPFDEVEPQAEPETEADPEPVTAVDDVVSEGEYVPSEDEEDDADPTYGAPKARRLVIHSTVFRSAANQTRAHWPGPPPSPCRRHSPKPMHVHQPS